MALIQKLKIIQPLLNKLDYSEGIFFFLVVNLMKCFGKVRVLYMFNSNFFQNAARRYCESKKQTL